jgi:X-Pro dipeptidyl-peptidase
VLVDYGPGTQITRSGDGIADTATRDCWGVSTTREFPPGTVIDHGACYLQVSKPEIAVTQWRVTRGILDSANRTSLTAPEPVTPAMQTRFSWPLVPSEHVIPKGHRLGVVLVANYSGLGVAGTAGTTFTLDTKASKVLLPVVGGYRALAATRAFSPEAGAPVMTGMPADIVVAAQDETGAVVDYPIPTATDDETPDPTVACTPPPGSRFPVGATTVTCTATDAYDNARTHAFTVTVVGKGSPPPSNAPGDPLPPTLDVDVRAPVLGGLAVRPLRRALRIRFSLDEDASVRVVVTRKGAKRPMKVKTFKVRAGRRSVALRLGRMSKGRYRITVRATDAAGNAGKPKARRLAVDRALRR